MRTVTKVAELRPLLDRERRAGSAVGFVPTMGALHEGHLSLVARARADCEAVVLSIFVNPLQFGPGEDFERYPRDAEKDWTQSEKAGVDFLFVPSVDEMYPAGAPETVAEVGRIGEISEGARRPGHFNGVATVCLKLFNIVGPCRAYFGRKDAQQLAVVRRMVNDLNLPVEIVGCPTVREVDGVAMSSRNVYLDGPSRAAAAVLSRSLFEARSIAAEGERSAEKLERIVADRVGAEPLVRLQYVEAVHPETFEEVDEIAEGTILALAADIGKTRLIDNVTLTSKASETEVEG
jgi:pantoate--beta-alanine ligase